MNIQPVTDLLAPVALGAPNLRVLIPNEQNYSVLLFQPRGRIEASADGVRHRNRQLAHDQFRRFLHVARNVDAELAVTPEYSMPWEVLAEAITTGQGPADGALWALGCESITYADLEALKQELAPHATVLCEPLQSEPHRFVDPLAYLFRTPRSDSDDLTQLVVLVQFKTCPMGDPDHFEVNGMQRGTRVYQFGNAGTGIRLITLICSDALAFSDTEAQAIYDRSLVLHIQLNPKPRQTQFRQYRARLLGFQGNETELVCLNWAKDVCVQCGSQEQCWRNISGSAWYLRPDKFDTRDQTLSANHRNGLYYTWLDSLRSHALFLNYEPAVYQVTATKVAHIGVIGSLARRRGPQLTTTYTWDGSALAWVDRVAPDDGFTSIVAECGDARDQIADLAANNPFEAERVLALCAGKIGNSHTWHSVRKLDSCIIDSSEVIRRITFCQDTDQDACNFRVARLRRCRRLWGILTAADKLPPAIADLNAGFRFVWTSSSPHQNVISTDEKRATVIYLGEEVNDAQIQTVAKRAAEYLHRSYANPDERLEARQRLHVWYRNNDGDVELFDGKRFLKYDDPRSASEFDIARTT